MKKNSLMLAAILFSAFNSFSQIRLSSIKVDDWVKKNFSGQGVVIGNVKFKGYPLSTLSYTSTPNILQVQNGLILSTGNSYNVAGYNNSHNQSSTFGDMSTPQTDLDLSAMVSGKLYDVCSVEFDFVPMDNRIEFKYQFGSDEYPEYVDSPYNDVFAFIVSDESASENIALIPGTKVLVSINSVNYKLNQDYFIDNNLYKQVVIKRQQPIQSTYKGTLPGRVLKGIGNLFSISGPTPGDKTVIQADPELLKKLDPNIYRNLRYDGITKMLVAQSYVTPYKKYHLKIVIADVADNIYDSGVFIEDRSLKSSKDVQQPDFVDYPDLSKVIDPNLILQGKTLQEILPADYKLGNTVQPKQVPVLAQTIIPSTAPASVPATNLVQKPTPAPKSEPSPNQEKPITQAKVKTLPSPKPKDVSSPAQRQLLLTEPAMELPNAVILFDFDKSDLNNEELLKLKAVVESYKKLKNQYAISISGHTDNFGSLEYNYALSDRRNKTIVKVVSQVLGEEINIPAISKSFTLPVRDNSTESGRQSNRRVELVFTKIVH